MNQTEGKDSMSNLQKNNKIGSSDRNLCSLRATCSGCQLWEVPWPEQKELKLSSLENAFAQAGILFHGKISYTGPAPFGLRDRLDFTYENGHLGLYHQQHHKIVDLPICLQLSPELQAWLTEFRKIRWPLVKAAFRLRVNPQGQRGVWIDCANIDIKELLAEGSHIRALQKQSFVEIGQRRKVPVEVHGVFKLRESQLNPWFQTWLDDQTPIPLYCQVASFTQPSHLINKTIAGTIRSWVQQINGKRIIEFGSGIGNLTIPALSQSEEIWACEIDKGALAGLQKSLEELPSQWQHLQKKIHLYAGDFQRKIQSDFSRFDLVLANPPRSGLLQFLDSLQMLEPSKRPPHFIYMSCYPQSLCGDLIKLQKMGYAVQDVLIVDQFPQTEHAEVLCLIKR